MANSTASRKKKKRQQPRFSDKTFLLLWVLLYIILQTGLPVIAIEAADLMGMDVFGTGVAFQILNMALIFGLPLAQGWLVNRQYGWSLRRWSIAAIIGGTGSLFVFFLISAFTNWLIALGTDTAIIQQINAQVSRLAFVPLILAQTWALWPYVRQAWLWIAGSLLAILTATGLNAFLSGIIGSSGGSGTLYLLSGGVYGAIFSLITGLTLLTLVQRTQNPSAPADEHTQTRNQLTDRDTRQTDYYPEETESAALSER